MRIGSTIRQRIDELYTAYPFYGQPEEGRRTRSRERHSQSQASAALDARDGHTPSVASKPDPSQPHPQHKVYHLPAG